MRAVTVCSPLSPREVRASRSSLTRLSSERCVRVDTKPDTASTARLTAGPAGKELLMADESNKVVAEVRDSFGKGAARKIRAAGKIPAVIYGHGTDPVHITVPAHQVGLLLRKANAVLDVEI